MNSGYLGKNLKKLRKDGKLSQNKLGDILGVSGAYIQQLEKGIKTNPSVDLIYHIATYFDVSPMNLLEFDLSDQYQVYAKFSELSEYIRNQALKKDENFNTNKFFNQLFLKPSEWEENKDLIDVIRKAAYDASKLYPYTGDSENWILDNLDQDKKAEYIKKSKEYLEGAAKEPNVYDPSTLSNEDQAMCHLKALVWYVTGKENLLSDDYDQIFDQVVNIIKYEIFKIQNGNTKTENK